MTGEEDNRVSDLGRRAREWRGSSEYRRHWPKDLKDEIVTCARQGVSVEALSCATGIHQATISKWDRQDRKAKELFSELAVVSHSRAPSRTRSEAEIEIQTARGHHVRLSLVALGELFRIEVL